MSQVLPHIGAEPAAAPASSRSGSGLFSIVKSPKGARFLVVFSDAAALFVAFGLFYLFRIHSGFFPDLEGHPAAVVFTASTFVALCWLFLFWFTGVYVNVHNRAFFDEYYTVLKTIVIGFLLLVAAVYIGTESIPSGQRSYRLITLLVYFVLVAGCVGIGRYLVRIIVRRLRKSGFGLRNTLIIGDSPRSRGLLEMFVARPELGYRVVGTVPVRHDVEEGFARGALGGLDDLDRIVRDHKVEVTVLGLEHEHELALRLMTETAVASTTIKIIPDLYDIVNGRARAQHLYGIPLIEVDPQIMPVWQQHIKRTFDVLFSTGVLLLGLPVWIIAAILVKLEDRGPIFYRQERVGEGGRTFIIYKIRSMRVDAERSGAQWAVTNDPRVTRIGRIIRKLHVDEAPQFWNIIKGDMSIVGPRPERPIFVEKYSKLIPAYTRRLRVKPGLTGWNQVQMDHMIENEEFVRERLRHDFFYIENMSLRLDIEIILRTILRVIQRKGQA